MAYFWMQIYRAKFYSLFEVLHQMRRREHWYGKIDIYTQIRLWLYYEMSIFKVFDGWSHSVCRNFEIDWRNKSKQWSPITIKFPSIWRLQWNKLIFSLLITEVHNYKSFRNIRWPRWMPGGCWHIPVRPWSCSNCHRRHFRTLKRQRHGCKLLINLISAK